MRIGIDARMYGTKATTGIGAYIKELTDNLFIIDQNNEYYLFLLPEVFDSFQVPNARVKKIKVTYPWYSWQEQIFFPWILKKYKLDLVHFPQFNVPILYNKNFVVTIHDITPKLFPGPIVSKSWIRKLGFNLTFAHALKKANQIITISEHTKNNIKNNFKVNPNKIKVIYLGISSKYQVVDNLNLIRDIKDKYSIVKPFMFFAGVWRDHKNLPGLIEAFNILKNKKHDYQLVLTGEPDSHYPEITQAINNSPYKNDIITPGFVSEEDLILLYNAAKLFIFPSFAEGFGLIALESLACGTPVIASSTTSLPEILEDSTIYFDPQKPDDIAQTAIKVLTNQNLYDQIKNTGATRIKKFNWLDTAKSTLKIYTN